MMTSWHYQRNRNLQNYFYCDGNTFLVWKVSPPWTLATPHALWLEIQKLKRKITFSITAITRSCKTKKQPLKKKEKVTNTDSINHHCNSTHLYLPLLTVIPLISNGKVTWDKKTITFISTGFYFLQPYACFRDTNIYIQVGWTPASNINGQWAAN